MPRRPKLVRPVPERREVDWSDPQMLTAAARLELATRERELRYRTDPWAFVAECVQTLDQITGETKPVPPKAHLEYLTTLWAMTVDEEGTVHYPPVPGEPLACPLLAVPKSRRMMVSWLFVALNYWLARTRPGAKIAFFARKSGEKESEGSNELVWRAHFIHRHLPILLQKRPVDYVTGRLLFLDTQSEIVALPQGADQARQLTFTSALADEMAFWEQALETWVALKPTTEGGGRITVVSSAGPGTFEAICFDQLADTGSLAG